MRTTVAFALCLLGAVGASAGVLSVTHYYSQAAVDALGLAGLEFSAGAGTQSITVAPTADPSAGVSVPYDLWAPDVPRGFHATYNPAGDVQALTLDTLTALQPATPVRSDTNTLLIQAHAHGPGRQVTLTDLVLTLPNLAMYPVGDAVLADDATQPEDYLLVVTDLPLANGFILSGNAAIDWDGDLVPAPPAEQWFDVRPAYLPEPGTLVLLAMMLALAPASHARRA